MRILTLIVHTHAQQALSDLLLEDTHVDSVLEVLSQSQSGISGQGFYWVTSAEKGGHL